MKRKSTSYHFILLTFIHYISLCSFIIYPFYSIPFFYIKQMAKYKYIMYIHIYGSIWIAHNSSSLIWLIIKKKILSSFLLSSQTWKIQQFVCFGEKHFFFFFFNNVYVNVLMFGRRKNVSQLIFFLKVNLKQIQWNRKCFPIFRTCLLM